MVSVGATGSTVVVRACTPDEVPARCTGCRASSHWVHSRYVRHLADAALGGRPVRIELSVRRLYCENSTCPKVTFAEQIDVLTVRYQRRTPLLQRLVEHVGILLAGRGGARLLALLGVQLSRVSVPFHLTSSSPDAGARTAGCARKRSGARAGLGAAVGRARRAAPGPASRAWAQRPAGAAPRPRAPQDENLGVLRRGGSTQQSEPREDPRSEQVDHPCEHGDRSCPTADRVHHPRSAAVKQFWNATGVQMHDSSP